MGAVLRIWHAHWSCIVTHILRVVEVTNGLKLGGAEMALVNRLRSAPADVETTIVDRCPSIQSPMITRKLKALGVKKLEIRSKRNLLTFLQQCNPDVIILRTPRDVVLFAAAIHKKLPSAITVFEAHSERVSQRAIIEYPIRWLLRRCNSNIDLHIAVSVTVSQGPQCANAKDIHVLYLGSTVDVRTKSALPPAIGTRFIFLGRFHAIKRPVWLLERIAAVQSTLRRHGAECVMVGDGPLLPDIHASIEKLGIQDIVRIAGHSDEPSEYLLSSDCLLLASRFEGLPLSVFEARLAGLRILSTPVGGVWEVINEDDSLCQTFGGHEFERALVQQALRGRLGTGIRISRMRANGRFDSKNLTQAYYQLLRSSLRRT